MEVTITTDNFQSYLNGDLPLVVDLWATWCGPCKMIAPVISQLAEEYDGKIVVGKCDVEENDDEIPGIAGINGINGFSGLSGKRKEGMPAGHSLFM